MSLFPKPFDFIFDNEDENDLNSEIDDNITNSSPLNDQIHKKQNKSAFTGKVNKWYSKFNDNTPSIINLLSYIHK